VKNVFVSGVFDMLHSGHVEFLRTAASYGKLHVSIGSDTTVMSLKGRRPIYSERERLFIVQAIRYVNQAFVGSGSGALDFLDEFKQVQPDIHIVNRDGHLPEKEQLCRRLGVEYIVLERTVAPGLARRSTTEVRGLMNMPYRIDLAGGWLDQPWVSKKAPGPVITISIEPTHNFFSRSGMATSTRERAIQLWGSEIPFGNPVELARLLFCSDNMPGTEFVSGSQDALGIVLPGANRLHYAGGYWPESIDSILEEENLTWLEEHLKLVPLFPRPDDYSVISNVNVHKAGAETLAQHAEACWEAVRRRDLPDLGAAVSGVLQAQFAMFPNMLTDEIRRRIDALREMAHGIKLTGAGGGGYLALVTDQTVEGCVPIRIRRHEQSQVVPARPAGREADVPHQGR